MALDEQGKSVLRGALASVRAHREKQPMLTQGRSGVKLCPVELIQTTKQPREDFGLTDGVRLTESIRAARDAGQGIEGTGILAPLIVRIGKNGYYILIAGERRLQAAIELNLPYVPVIVQDVSDIEAYRLGITENVQRKALSPIEEGDAYIFLMESGDTIAAIAQAIGLSEGYVNNRTAASKRPEDLREMVKARPKTMEQSRLIDMVKEPTERERLIKKVVEEKAPVEEIQEEIRQLDRRGLVKGARVSSRKKENGSVSDKVPPPKIYVDWDGIKRDLANSTNRLMRNLNDVRPRGKIRSELLDSIAAAEKDLRAARAALGSEIHDDEE